ncbi:hypothetical protein CK203_002101 [Vitis vinifera]|uniref:DUF4283 domain-containing protein n=1 Tax=Vitis vinifera TaxID=29760 RepID=A0A438KJF7_VITVI|nr:hypothetical protein CK203_002101 [Vitis vinifera]
MRWEKMELSRVGRSQFVVESKSFEILVEDLGGKLKGCIWEKSRGKGQSSGWNSLAERLRGLGVAPTGGLKVTSGPEDSLRMRGGSKVLWREKGVEVKSFADAVKSTPGRVGKSWTLQHWALKGNLRVVVLGKGLLLFDFELPHEAKRVLARGKRSIKENFIILDRWNPEVGCLCKNSNANEAWVRVVGLPHLHLWSLEVFKRIGDGCGALVGVSTLVHIGGASGKFLRGGQSKGRRCEDVSLAGGNPSTPPVEVSGIESDVRGKVGVSVGLVRRGRESSFNNLNDFVLGPEGLCCGPSCEPNGLEIGRSKAVSVDATGEGALDGDKPPVTLSRAQSEPSISKERGISGGASGDDNPLVRLSRDALPTEAFETTERGSMTIEALREEAARYIESLSFPVGGQELSSSTPSSGFGRAMLNEGNGEMASEGRSLWLEKVWGGEFEELLQDPEGKVVDGQQLPSEVQQVPGYVLGGSSQSWCGKILGLGCSECKEGNWWGGWILVDLYGGLRTYIEKIQRTIWEELGVIRGLWSDPWCIGGDFNVIRFPSERSRVGRLFRSMRRFSEVIDELALRDLPLQEEPFTWSGGLNGQSRWGGVRRGPIPFRFENMWLKEEGFKELLKGWWQVEELEQGSFWKNGVNKRLALDKVSFWDDQERLRVLNEQELEARKEAREDFKKWALMEEISWRQKSRETWLKEGDKNTGFFHKMANSNRRRNCLKKIKVNGIWLLEDQEIQRGVMRAYQNLLSDPGGWHPSMNSLEFDRIGLRRQLGWRRCFLWKRPISLVGGLYKLLAKVLANRLKKVVSKVASSTQNAFVEGRQILDAALIANKAIYSLLKRDETGMEALSCLINRAVRRGFLTGCKIRERGGNGIQVSHLLFVDDTLSINLNKSEILPVGRVENVEVLASELGCKVGTLPSTYLGLPLGAPHKSMVVRDGVEERMRKRLALWKRQFISKGGRITLIQSTLKGEIWKDIWCGNNSICETYPSLFALAVSKDAWVADYWDSLGEVGGWIPRFSRPFNDWEVEAVERLLSTLQGKRLAASLEDRVSRFRGASFGALVFLQRCFLCCAEEETINNILVHCPKARVMWDLVFSLFGVTWVLPLTIRDTLLGWFASFVDKKRGKTWQAAPLYLFWTVWKERNNVCNLFSWAKACLEVGPLSLINFVDWLGSC